MLTALLYLWINGKGFVRLAHTEEVIDYLLHSKIQSFLEEQKKAKIIHLAIVLKLRDTNTFINPAGHLSYELDDLNKDVEGRVSGNNAPRAFGEKC